MWRPKGDLGLRKNPLTDSCWVSGPELNCLLHSCLHKNCMSSDTTSGGLTGSGIVLWKENGCRIRPLELGHWCRGPSGDFPFHCSPALPVKDAFGIMSFFLWSSSASQTHPPGLRSELQEGASRVILLGPLLS